jgi:alkylation response protein AidB-like acyl-CoA dehydrogenase
MTAPLNVSADVLESLTREFDASAAHHDRTGQFPFQNFTRLHELSLLSLVVPREQGGQGGTLEDALRVIGAVAKGDPSTALVLTMHYIHMRMLCRPRWPAAVRERIVGEVLGDGALINAFRTEPQLGNPLRGGVPETKATRVEGGWLINGRKAYGTGIPLVRWLLVWAASDAPGYKPGHWLVHRDSPGIRVVESWDHLGMRATASHDLILEDVFVPDALDIDGPEGDFYTSDTEVAAWASVLIPAIYDGVARAARDWFVDWLQSRTRSNIGAPLSKLPKFHDIVGRIEAMLFESRLALLAGARGEVPREQANHVKYIVTNNAIRAVELMIANSGNPGLMRTNPLERHLRNVLCARIHGPHDDQHLAAVGKSVLEPDAPHPSQPAN